MERFLKVTKPTTLKVNEKTVAPHNKKPYDKSNRSSVTKHLLSSLTHEKNPITHSDVYLRTKHIISASTGHQVQDGRVDRRAYNQHRSEKLGRQREVGEDSALILSGAHIYIDGYLENTTDIEMKRLISIHGGNIRNTPSRATHILSSRALNASKNEQMLRQTKVKVVRPEWVLDSIAAGKKLSEREYIMVKDVTRGNLAKAVDI